MVSNEVAILYGGTVQKHSAYSLDLSFTEQTKAMPKNAAYVKNGSDFSYIKVVQGD